MSMAQLAEPEGGVMDLKALQKEAHAIAREKGWWDEPRTFGDLIALVHSELSEALEVYRVCGNSRLSSRTHRRGRGPIRAGRRGDPGGGHG